MRVGVYIDGFNLYRGVQRLSGSSTQQWKWLDMRALALTLAERNWARATIERVIYCTTIIAATTSDPDAPRRQQTYLRALRKSGSVDWVEKGKFYEKTKIRPMAIPDARGRPVITRPQRPVLIKDGNDQDDPGATFMVSVADREEKGTDVNLASHLLIDTLEGRIDAAIVVSNDSDFAFPVKEARKRIPIGIANPTPQYTAGFAHEESAWRSGGPMARPRCDLRSRSTPAP